MNLLAFSFELTISAKQIEFSFEFLFFCKDSDSWLSEYKRLTDNVPAILTEDINDAHNHQVLHVSFSHNGEMFATCSKDGCVVVSIGKSENPSALLCDF